MIHGNRSVRSLGCCASGGVCHTKRAKDTLFDIGVVGLFGDHLNHETKQEDADVGVDGCSVGSKNGMTDTKVAEEVGSCASWQGFVIQPCNSTGWRLVPTEWLKGWTKVERKCGEINSV